VKEKQSRPVKTFKITHKGYTVTLETEHKRADSVNFILATLFHELRNIRPDKLDRLMELMTYFYNRTLKEEAAKTAKREGRMLPVVEGPEPDTFEFWRDLMETPPAGVGEGGEKHKTS
jgi:hypothetical protein